MNENIRYPSEAQVSELYDRTIQTTGGERGLVSKSNLAYLLDAIKDIGDRLPRRKSIVKKASFLLYNVIVIHPFLNGNKRTAFGLAGSFLEVNGLELAASPTEAYEFLLGIASGKIPEIEVEEWVASQLSELTEEE